MNEQLSIDELISVECESVGMKESIMSEPPETEKESRKVYLVDGSGYIFRAYYAVAPLTTRDGFPTNALFGFTRMLLKLLSQLDSDHVVMVFDAGRETFRNEIYPEYKANRDECPEELVKQMPYFREITTALGVKILELPGYEADDVIGAIAQRLSNAGVDNVIVSADKDFMQLITDHTAMWDSMRDRWFGAEEVQKKFGVGPEQVVEFLALAGDSSDNIPGLRGVGPKTATQLIEKYGDVESILASAEQIREDKSIRNRKKISDQIESDPEIVRLSRRLVQICTEAPVVLSVGNCDETKTLPLADLSDEDLIVALKRGERDVEQLSDLIDRLEFTSFAKEFALVAQAKTADPAADYQTIYKKDFKSWAVSFKAQRCFSFDLETTSLDPQEAKIVGAAFCWSDTEAYYVPFLHTETEDGEEQITLTQFLEECGAHLTSNESQVCGQNLKYDLSVLMVNGVEVSKISFDTMIAAYLLNPDRGSYNLTTLSNDFLGRTPIEYKEIIGDHEDFRSVPVKQATAYAAEDAHLVWLLMEELAPKLKEFELERVFHELELPLVPVLAEMELSGVLLDTDLLDVMSKQFAERLEELRSEVFKVAGEEFNVNSPKQLSEILFNKLGIPTAGVKKTKTGFSTNSSVLEMLRHDYPLAELILEYRSIHKLKSTYVDALPAQISPVSGRLHSRFNQTVTATGRLSSSSPNLQNIPVQTEAGRRIRKAFVPGDEQVLISADYSQIELRLLAHLSEDEGLTRAFQTGEDIHAKTAREMLHIAEDDEITPEERRIGKTMNFGIIYGMSAFRLSKELGIPIGVAAEYIENYFQQFPRVRGFFDGLEAESKKTGFVETFFGRKRFVGQIDSSGRDRGFVRRASMNAPIQGSAADVIKLAMIRISDRIKRDGCPLTMILQIHDELVFTCETAFTDEAVSLIRDEMEAVVELRVPLKVDTGFGKNWDEAH